MEKQPSIQSIKTIRTRLILILVRAFLVVAVVGSVALLTFTFLQISRNSDRNPFFRDPAATVLEAYFLGHGSWEGVQALVDPNLNPSSRFLQQDWESSILLDENGRLVMYYGKALSNLPGDTRMPTQTEEIQLRSFGKVIGTLVLEKHQVSRPVRFTLGVLSPVFLVALFLILLIVIIGVLLMRRMVNPLAEVIAAAESVAAGKLDTRIQLTKGQDDLNALGIHFNHMTETLERNDTERRALLADIAHELRTPLSVLRGRMEGIMDGVYPADEPNIAQALEETYLLERLVDDLRLLTLAETRQLHFEKKPTNLVELLQKTLNVFEPQAKSRNIEVRLHTGLVAAFAETDPQRMEQVIGNLVGNSMRYVSEGSRIEMSLAKVGGDLVIKVSDNGPGVKEEDLPFIFDRFWRGDKSRARASGGAGLGLAISRQLVEAQGGKITAANRVEGGLEITVTLPEFKE